MPYSSPIFDNELELYFREVRHSSVLDIGAGEGALARPLATASDLAPPILAASTSRGESATSISSLPMTRSRVWLAPASATM